MPRVWEKYRIEYQIYGIILLLPSILLISLFLSKKYNLFWLKEKLVNYFFKTSSIRFMLFMTTLAFLLIIIIVFFVLGIIPTIIDGDVMYFQAKIFSSGPLYTKPPPIRDFFQCNFMVTDSDRFYAKYFFGHSLILAIGFLLSVPWLIGPLEGLLSLVTIYLICR